MEGDEISFKKKPAHYMAQFDMGILDYQRMHHMLMRADFLSFEVNCYNTNYIREYYSILVGIFRNVSVVMYYIKRFKINVEVRLLDNIIKEWEHEKMESIQEYIPFEIIDRLNNLHNRILMEKQI